MVSLFIFPFFLLSLFCSKSVPIFFILLPILFPHLSIFYLYNLCYVFLYLSFCCLLIIFFFFLSFLSAVFFFLFYLFVSLFHPFFLSVFSLFGFVCLFHKFAYGKFLCFPLVYTRPQKQRNTKLSCIDPLFPEHILMHTFHPISNGIVLTWLSFTSFIVALFHDRFC